MFHNLQEILGGLNVKQNEEDGMFTKKPFTLNSCASCDNDLRNAKFNKALYSEWNKFPSRPESSRLSNIGSGFSHILKKVKNKDVKETDEENTKDSPLSRPKSSNSV